MKKLLPIILISILFSCSKSVVEDKKTDKSCLDIVYFTAEIKTTPAGIDYLVYVTTFNPGGKKSLRVDLPLSIAKYPFYFEYDKEGIETVSMIYLYLPSTTFPTNDSIAVTGPCKIQKFASP